LLPLSLYRFAKVNTPANRQLPIASVDRRQCKNKKKLILVDKYSTENEMNRAINQEKRKKRNTLRMKNRL